MSSLLCATRNSHHEVVRELLNAKSDANQSDQIGNYALTMAVKKGDMNVVSLHFCSDI